MTNVCDRLRPAQVLLVEDNRGDAILAQLAFKRSRCGGEVIIAETAEEGLRMLRREGEYAATAHPDIILLDLNLPHMNGQEFLSIVKSDIYLRHLPVIVLSSSSADSDVASCYQLFANGYITKPFNTREYDTIIATLAQYWFTLMHVPPDRVVQ